MDQKEFQNQLLKISQTLNDLVDHYDSVGMNFVVAWQLSTEKGEDALNAGKVHVKNMQFGRVCETLSRWNWEVYSQMMYSESDLENPFDS